MAQVLEDKGPVAIDTFERIGDLSVSGGVTLVSDYRFRGISQSDKRFAVQGSVTVDHASGFYGTVWGSSIDDYVYHGADQEIDLSAGYRTTSDGTTVDVGLLYYFYPGSGATGSDFLEPYASVSHTYGPLTGRFSAAYAPRKPPQSIGSGRKDNLYIAGDLSAGLPGTPVSLSAHLGHSFGSNNLPAGDNYTDWGLAASYTTKGLTFGLGYADTDVRFTTPSGRGASQAGLVASLGVSF